MQAESFVKTAQMVAEETTDEFNPGVSASLAVLAALAPAAAPAAPSSPAEPTAPAAPAVS